MIGMREDSLARLEILAHRLNSKLMHWRISESLLALCSQTLCPLCKLLSWTQSVDAVFKLSTARPVSKAIYQCNEWSACSTSVGLKSSLIPCGNIL